MKRKNGVTLVELLIAVSLGSMLLVTAFKLMSNWMKSSVKGASHLTNMQTAVLLSNQIEHDLQRAIKIELNDKNFQISTIEDVGGAKAEEDVSYEETANSEGLRRATFSGGSLKRDRVLCAGFRLNRIDSEPILQKITFPGGKYCIKIQFQIASVKNEEPYAIEKLILCANLRENDNFPGWFD